MDLVCRICLKANANNSFLKLTNECSGELVIYDCYKILTCIDLEDQKERDLSRICQECLKRLDSCIDFRSLAIKNNDYFKNLKIGN